MKRNGWTHKFLALWSALLMALLLSGASARAQQNNPQPALLGAQGASDEAVVFPDPGNAPATQKLVNLPADARPQGVSYYGSDNALLSDRDKARIFVVQVSTATLLATIDTSAVGYDGSGTIAVAPDRNTALAMGDETSPVTNTLYIIRGPFNAGSTINQVTLPGSISGAQTQAIVFNNAGRAFVYTTAGISVLDAPYTSVAFTIPSGRSGGAIAITPDGNTLLATTFSNMVSIFQAPFSAASTPALLTVPNGSGLDGIKVSPDGSKAIVVSNVLTKRRRSARPSTAVPTCRICRCRKTAAPALKTWTSAPTASWRCLPAATVVPAICWC